MNIFLKKRVTVRQNQGPVPVIIIAGLVSLAAYFISILFTPERPLPYSDRMIDAARMMEKAITTIRDHCDTSGIKIDATTDPNRTGLIGPEYSDLTTTIGHLEAKRTTTNPDIAGLIVHLLHQAGVTPGDTVAIGSSASFPALMIASLAASQAMEVYPIIIISLGASSYGATNTEFNMLHMVELLLRKTIFSVPPAAISLGGEKDIGHDFNPDIKKRLIQQIQSRGIPFIHESNLTRNVATRMEIFQGNTSDGRISAFINTGGSFSNMGTSSLALKIKPGLNENLSIPPKKERGVIFEMATRHVPIIHLLYVKGLVLKYGLPWNPVPLPKTGEARLYDTRSQLNNLFWLVCSIYFVLLIILILHQKEKIVAKLRI